VLLLAAGCASAIPDKVGIAPFYTQSHADAGLIESDGDAYGATIYFEWQLRPQRMTLQDAYGKPVEWPQLTAPWPTSTQPAPAPVIATAAPVDHAHPPDDEPVDDLTGWLLGSGGVALLAGALGLRQGRRTNGGE